MVRVDDFNPLNYVWERVPDDPRIEQPPQSVFTFRCIVCGRILSQMDDIKGANDSNDLEVFHYVECQFGVCKVPDCEGKAREIRRAELELELGKRRLHDCPVCSAKGIVGDYAYQVHQATHSKDNAKQTEKKEKDVEEFSLTQSVMILASLRSAQKPLRYTEIKQVYENLFAKQIADAPLSRTLAKLVTEGKIAKHPDGLYELVT